MAIVISILCPKPASGGTLYEPNNQVDKKVKFPHGGSSWCHRPASGWRQR